MDEHKEIFLYALPFYHGFTQRLGLHILFWKPERPG